MCDPRLSSSQEWAETVRVLAQVRLGPWMRAFCTEKLQQRSIGWLMFTPRARSMLAREERFSARWQKSCSPRLSGGGVGR